MTCYYDAVSFTSGHPRWAFNHHLRKRRKADMFLSARAKRRHPMEKGDKATRAMREVIQILLDHRFWAKHPAPFNKTARGFARRSERKFKMEMRNAEREISI